MLLYILVSPISTALVLGYLDWDLNKVVIHSFIHVNLFREKLSHKWEGYAAMLKVIMGNGGFTVAWLKLKVFPCVEGNSTNLFPFFSYSCFDKGCPVIALKRAQQSRLVLWVVKVYHCLIDVHCVKQEGRTHVSVFSLVLVLTEKDISNTQGSVQPHFKHLEVRQKYAAAHLTFYSLLSVWKSVHYISHDIYLFS